MKTKTAILETISYFFKCCAISSILNGIFLHDLVAGIIAGIICLAIGMFTYGAEIKLEKKRGLVVEHYDVKVMKWIGWIMLAITLLDFVNPYSLNDFTRNFANIGAYVYLIIAAINREKINQRLDESFT